MSIENPSFVPLEATDKKILTPEEFAKLQEQVAKMTPEQQKEFFKKMTGKDMEDVPTYEWTTGPDKKDE